MVAGNSNLARQWSMYARRRFLLLPLLLQLASGPPVPVRPSEQSGRP